MQTFYLGLGSNLGDRENQLLRALELLDIEILRVSHLYQTAHVGPTPAPDHLNCCTAVRTQLSPEQLMQRCLDVEKELGRNRTYLNSSREIDIDILLMGDAIREGGIVHLPHPRLHLRRFVLEPLAEIAPLDLVVPKTGQTIGELLAEVQNQRVERLEKKLAPRNLISA